MTALLHECGDALVRGLVHASARRRPFARIQPTRDAKRFATIAARARLAGDYRVYRIEDDQGTELLIAVRGAETWRFANLAEAEGWLGSVIANGRTNSGAEVPHAAR